MLEWFRFALKTVAWPIKVRNIKKPEKAREKARKISKNFNEKVCPKFWVNVVFEFSEKTRKNYPEIIQAIENYIKTWELSDKLPLLWLWNHQAFGLEAIWAYAYFPKNWRIVLKDDLLKPPFFWNGIKAIDPIVYYRWEKNAEIKRDIEVKNTLLQKKAVLIYPEGTRSKDGNIRGFDYKKYKAWYEIITNIENEVSSKVVIITADTMKVLPNTMEDSILMMWDVNPWIINYTIDIVDVSLYENIRSFNKDIKDIITWNLQKEKS